MPKIVELFLWLAYPFCALAAWYYYIRYKHQERIHMIEKGIRPEDHLPSQDRGRSLWLKLGMVVMGLGLGLLIITILVNLHLTGQSDAIYPSILCLCGGGALVAANFINPRKK